VPFRESSRGVPAAYHGKRSASMGSKSTSATALIGGVIGGSFWWRSSSGSRRCGGRAAGVLADGR